MLMKAGRLFTKLNRGEGEGRRRRKKKQLVSVRGSELFIDFHGSCFSLITHEATVKTAAGNSSRRRRGPHDTARISRGRRQIPQLIESQSVSITEAVFLFPPPTPSSSLL